MARQGDFGGNPLGHFTPPFPTTPATIGSGAQASQAPFQANPSDPFISGAGMQWSGHPGANALAPPPQAFQPHSHHHHWTMAQAGAPNANPFQHFAGGGAPPPLHGEDLAARVAAINNVNILASQPFQPNNYTHGWTQPPPQAPLYNPAPQPVGNIAAPPPVGPNGYGAATGWAPPMPHPGWPTHPMQQPAGADTSWAAPMQQQQQMMSWAPPAQQQQQPGGGETMSWAPPPEQRPGVFPGGGSAHQAQAPAKGKTFEEFLMDAGVLDDGTVDEMLVGDLMKDLMGDDAPAKSGTVQPDGPMVGVGGYGRLPPPVAAGSYSSGPSYMMRGEEEQASSGRDPEAAAEARARRGRRMAKRKEAIARARPGN
ncbi:unnamed protein product [Urochloa decumbens]|uniref:BZIP domain-containing protein n=1 Tax=Urochloa decumbens TaxID=240449 RepID=A0ABC9FCC4_9POAL